MCYIYRVVVTLCVLAREFASWCVYIPMEKLYLYFLLYINEKEKI